MGNKNAHLSKKDQEYLQKNTNFNKKEIKKWHKGFMRDCPDGLLTKEMFNDVYAQFFPGGYPAEFCDHVFRSFDKDNSGNIEFTEFICAINITSNKSDAKSKLNWAFTMYDIDGNGTIDMDEMESIIKAIFMLAGTAIQEKTSVKSPKERTAEIFETMDDNGDGVLTREEFVRGCMNDRVLYQMLTADASKS